VNFNEGGGPTEDKPDVALVLTTDLEMVSSFMNIRAADIRTKYDGRLSKRAKFSTPPIDRGGEI
jgi:hypothetical protein